MTSHASPHAPGSALPEVVHKLTQDQISAYAGPSGDHNPLHLDPEFAARTRFGGTIAHGMLVLAFISEMMTAGFGTAWAAGGRLKVRFRDAARPGDTVTARGTITAASSDRITCEVECVNQAGVVLISGETEVRLT